MGNIISINMALTKSRFFNWAPRQEGVVGEWRLAPRILDLGTRWRWVVSFMPWPLYPQGKRPRYPLDGRLGPSRYTTELSRPSIIYIFWIIKKVRLYHCLCGGMIGRKRYN
jgi:hypothetical protein